MPDHISESESESERSACEVEEIEALDAIAGALPPDRRAEHAQFWSAIYEPHLRLDAVLERLGFVAGERWRNLREAMRDAGFSLDQMYSLSPFDTLEILESRAKTIERIRAKGLRKASPLLRRKSGADGGRPEGVSIDIPELRALRGTLSWPAFTRVLGMKHVNTLMQIVATGRASDDNAQKIEAYKDRMLAAKSPALNQRVKKSHT
jgi:hypothetical protein